FAHSAAPDGVRNLVRPDGLPGARLILRHQIGGHSGGQILDPIPVLLVKDEQRFHFTAQFVVAAAGFGQESGARGRLASQRLLQQLIYLLPTFRSHCSDISRISQALAVFQSRITVPSEMPSASAVSSMLSPPKQRNSTTRLLRRSIFASSASASSSAIRSAAR